ncbi:hypothetical protein AB0D49_30915 [Streptomyces sp. NPDC048290]|uniref:hypothetical protein n=1 Tax=Streptomyces sp. NPDC048290 TaxID=3155811 RepID=UPI003446F572
MADHRDAWTTSEFGTSHEGVVGVLLADGTVPEPVYFDIGSGPTIESSSHWSVYDGHRAGVPTAAALRGVCSCGWTGTEYPIDEDGVGSRERPTAAVGLAGRCEADWDTHVADLEASAIPVPETVTALLSRLTEEIERLARSSPLAAVRAVRHMEIAAEDLGYWAARGVRQDTPVAQVATALKLDEHEARKLLARLGGWNPYF